MKLIYFFKKYLIKVILVCHFFIIFIVKNNDFLIVSNIFFIKRSHYKVSAKCRYNIFSFFLKKYQKNKYKIFVFLLLLKLFILKIYFT
ncbi:hypothetical protein DST59_09250 [Campylobacter coli]|nr:hypothetical protein [Campylobacter coli]